MTDQRARVASEDTSVRNLPMPQDEIRYEGSKTEFRGLSGMVFNTYDWFDGPRFDITLRRSDGESVSLGRVRPESLVLTREVAPR